MIKEAYIKKIGPSKYRVYSEKGKNMGTYDSLSAAKKRLSQIEFFKHKKASVEQKITYSFFMRFLNKNHKNLVIPFMKIFFKNFNNLVLNKENDINKVEKIALKQSIKDLLNIKQASYSNKLIKYAGNAINMGNPEIAGKRLADIIKFMLNRIKPESRYKVYLKMKEKVLKLNPDEISNKKTPATSSMGQAITFLKTVLIGNQSAYVKEILLNVAKNLG
jgi:hypothetical protein